MSILGTYCTIAVRGMLQLASNNATAIAIHCELVGPELLQRSLSNPSSYITVYQLYLGTINKNSGDETSLSVKRLMICSLCLGILAQDDVGTTSNMLI